MKENLEVVWPSGRSAQARQPLAARLDTLQGKTICGLYNGSFYFDQTLPLIRQLLARKYPNIKVIGWEEFGVVSDKLQGAALKDLPEKLKKYGCDAVISGRGC